MSHYQSNETSKAPQPLNTMKKSYFWTVVIIIIVICYISFNSSKGPVLDRPIVIGQISALTGVGSAIGEEERKGAQLAIEEINQSGGVRGRPLKLLNEDLSIDKIKNAISVVQKLITINEVVAIVGAQWDEPTEPVLPIIELAQIPTVGADNSDQLEREKDYAYYFSTWYDNRVGIREILRYMQNKGIKKVAIIRPIDAGFWKFTADSLATEAPKYNVEIVSDQNMGNPLSLDFRTYISKAKQTNPDAVFIVTSDYNQCAFQKQAKELDFSALSFGTESSGDQISLKNCSEFMTNRYFSSPKMTQRGQEFVSKFEERFGARPAFPSAITAYDAVYAIFRGLEKTKGEGGDLLRRAIANTDIEGAGIDKIKFNEKGFLFTPEDTFEMMVVRDGAFVKAN